MSVGENEGPEKGSLLAAGVRCHSSRRSSRSKGGGGTSQVAKLTSGQGRGLVKRASEVGYDGCSGVNSTGALQRNPAEARMSP